VLCLASEKALELNALSLPPRLRPTLPSKAAGATMLSLVFGTIRRSWLRMLLTGLSTLVAFALLGLFLAIRHSFAASPTSAGADLLLAQPLNSKSQLPIGILSKITTFPGVRSAAAFTGTLMLFGAEQHPVRLQALSSDAFLEISAVVGSGRLPATQASAWLSDPIGALVSAEAASRNNWRLGQSLTLHAMPGVSLPDLALHIDGIIAKHHGVSLSTDVNIHLGYFRRWSHSDFVSAIFIQVTQAPHADIVARAIELRFANSSTPLRTQTFKSMLQGMFERLADVNSITSVVIAASLFGLFLICFNAVIHSVSERLGEFALLKALGFPMLQLTWLVFVEAFLAIVPAAACGILCALIVVRPLAAARLNLTDVTLTTGALADGALIAISLTILSAGLPALRVVRLNCAQLLRRG
jgi:putative ABC transport system permease protein